MSNDLTNPEPVKRKRVNTPRTDAQREAHRVKMQLQYASNPALRELKIKRVVERYATDEAFRTRLLEAAHMRYIVKTLAAGKGLCAVTLEWYEQHGGIVAQPVALVTRGRKPRAAQPVA